MLIEWKRFLNIAVWYLDCNVLKQKSLHQAENKKVCRAYGMSLMIYKFPAASHY